MKLNEIPWQSFMDYITKTNPTLEKQEALYRLNFPNGKSYLGQSTDILARLETHLIHLRGIEKRGESAKWYLDACKDNGLDSKRYYEIIKKIDIQIYPCDNSYELEQNFLYEERLQGHQSLYYNSQFYKPRNWGLTKEKEGNKSYVIF